MDQDIYLSESGSVSARKIYIPVKPCSFSGCCISFIALNKDI